ncbi:MAG TPA: hypothetical protein VLV88_04140 [Terriglobales bacterium]|nr:hypothetical protein [Terriglobales bacterium]
MRVLSAGLIAVFVCSPSIARTKKAPLPEQILVAKTVYIVNQTKNAKLGETTSNELTKWGRFKIVQKPEDADLIVAVSIRSETVPADSEGAGCDSGTTCGGFSDFGEVHLQGAIHFDCITISDRQTKNQLWSRSAQIRFFVRNPIGNLVKELRKEIKDQDPGTKDNGK